MNAIRLPSPFHNEEFVKPPEDFMPLRYQHGYLRSVKRKTGPSQWEFLWRENVGGRRIRRTTVIGSVDQYPTEELAQAAVNGFSYAA